MLRDSIVTVDLADVHTQVYYYTRNQAKGEGTGTPMSVT